MILAEKLFENRIVVKMGSNYGRGVPGAEQKSNIFGLKTKKNLRNPKISKVFGGDKRDRTADLLNAMDCPRAVGCRGRLTAKKLLIFNTFSAWGA